MDAKKLSQVTGGAQPDWPTREEYRLLEEWYHSCETRPGLLQQLSRPELVTMKQQQFRLITERLEPKKNKLVLVVV
ncbi:hypothetical protein [Pseudoflavitalea rhizosphaerae]|uniref:hypothetical protein n=1 Tax=Pseudoflavitalea rhizosphaerae TaxID=1884793 RepID=UPI000F8E91B8|nr:hypothetical protein [Pseudoflavitalea rhizosphaerae]